MTSTSDTQGARAHARAMAANRIAAMPTLPVRDVTDAPLDVATSDLTWREVIGACGYAWRSLPRGGRLEVLDAEGDGCVSMLVFNDDLPIERLSVADTMKVQWTAYVGEGSLLLSDQGRVLMSVLHDDSGRHDTLCGPSTSALSIAATSTHPAATAAGATAAPWNSGRSRLLLSLARRGLDERDMHPCITWFKGVQADGDGRLTADLTTRPGRRLVLRADMNVFIAVANCAHPLAEAGRSPTPVRLTAWRGAAAAEGDWIRRRTPEAERAFLNVDDYFAQRSPPVLD